MDPFFAFIFIIAVASASYHADSAEIGHDPIEIARIEEPKPCPQDMAEPRVRDLTVPFEQRVYLLPSGETCRPAMLTTVHHSMPQRNDTEMSPERFNEQDIHDEPSEW